MSTFRPGKPALRAVLSADQALPASVFTTVAFNLSYYEEGDISLAAGAIAVGLDGRYDIHVGILRRAQATSYSLDTQLLVGGVVVSSQFSERSVQLACNSFSDHLVLAAGDSISVKARGALTVGAASSIALGSYLSVVRIGPKRWT